MLLNTKMVFLQRVEIKWKDHLFAKGRTQKFPRDEDQKVIKAFA